jgi:hypothetical protein
VKACGKVRAGTGRRHEKGMGVVTNCGGLEDVHRALECLEAKLL